MIPHTQQQADDQARLACARYVADHPSGEREQDQNRLRLLLDMLALLPGQEKRRRTSTNVAELRRASFDQDRAVRPKQPNQDQVRNYQVY